MQSAISFTLTQSGFPFLIRNALADSSSITLVYTVSGAPTSLVITIEGIVAASGTVQVLDSYSGTANTTRTVNLSAVYDAFKISAIFGGGKNVSVAATLTSTGAGPTFSTTSLSAVQSHSF